MINETVIKASYHVRIFTTVLVSHTKDSTRKYYCMKAFFKNRHTSHKQHFELLFIIIFLELEIILFSVLLPESMSFENLQIRLLKRIDKL